MLKVILCYKVRRLSVSVQVGPEYGTSYMILLKLMCKTVPALSYAVLIILVDPGVLKDLVK